MTYRLHRAHVSVQLIAFCLACVSAGCGSTVASSTGPSPAKCDVTLTPPAASIDPQGATATVAVSTPAECTWTASSDANWINGLTPTSGQGAAQIAVNVAANPANTSRQGNVVVNGVRAQIRQEAATCRFELSDAERNFDASGGTARIAVTAANGCAWTARAGAPWITISSGSTGNGSGSVTITVVANAGDARSSSLTIADRTVRITQDAKTVPPPSVTPSCTYNVNPTTLSLPASGSTKSSFSVDSSTGCSWTAAADVSWISITAGSSGSGKGSVDVSVAANTTTSTRTGSLTIAGRQVTVTEAGAAAAPCTYSVSPTTVSIGAVGGTSTPIGVTTSSACGWTAASNANWITVATGATGTGNGTVTYTVLANTGPARSGTLTVAGQAVTISQSSGCTFVISPTSQSFPSDGGKGGPVTVTTQSGCPWTATSNASWITITSGASGTGSGSVSFNVAGNDGNERTGTLTIAGSTFTVTERKR